jgi:hypothetical protein
LAEVGKKSSKEYEANSRQAGDAATAVKAPLDNIIKKIDDLALVLYLPNFVPKTD